MEVRKACSSFISSSLFLSVKIAFDLVNSEINLAGGNRRGFSLFDSQAPQKHQ